MWPSWDPAKAARELQPAENSGTSEDIMEGSGSRPVGPKAASSASADNPSRSPRSAPQCKITGRPLGFSCNKEADTLRSHVEQGHRGHRARLRTRSSQHPLPTWDAPPRTRFLRWAQKLIRTRRKGPSNSRCHRRPSRDRDHRRWHVHSTPATRQPRVGRFPCVVSNGQAEKLIETAISQPALGYLDCDRLIDRTDLGEGGAAL